MPTNGSSDTNKKKPKPCPDCPPPPKAPVSAEPVGYAEGQIALSETDLSWQGLGFSWSHTRSYANVVEGGTEPSLHGHNWFMTDLAFLDFDQSQGGGSNLVSVIRGTFTSIWFEADGSGGWQNRYGGYQTLTHNTAAREYTVTYQDGQREIFHDNDGGLSQSLRGRLKAIESAGGAKAALSYNLDDELESVVWTSSDGGSAEFAYTYFDDLERLGLIESVTLSVAGVAIRKANYNYYGVGNDHGPLRTLKNAEVTGKDNGAWETISKQWYRYYLADGGVGVKYGLKLVLGDNGTEAATRAGIDLDTADDDLLKPYSTHLFEYDAEARVTKEVVRGNTDTFGFTWMTNAANPPYSDVTTWNRRCIETRPDGTTMTVYTNRGGAKLLSILEDTASGDQWFEYFSYDDFNRLEERASSEAIDSVAEPANANGSLTVTLKTNEGLIEVNSFYAVDDFPNGKVKGYLESRGVKEGSGGTLEITQKLSYDTHSVGNVSVHPLKEKLTFMTAGVPDADAAKTTYERIWHTDSVGGDTLQVKQITTTNPVVSTADHGTGLDEKTDAVFDENGFEIWNRDPRGIITRNFYDELTAAKKRVVNDADPALLGDAPLGWVAPSFGGSNLVTDIVNDRLGRAIRKIGPEHSAVVDLQKGETSPCSSTAVEATTLRTVEFTMYLCPRHQTWMARGYVTNFGAPNESWNLLGPVTIEQRDAGGNSTDVIEAVATCDCGPLSQESVGTIDVHTQLPNQKHWSAWTHIQRDLWGRNTGERAYFAIPASGNGFKDENYFATEIGYDSVRRINRRVARDGTITRTVFDADSQPTERWVGTDDSGATASDPGNGGADGNNMKPAELFQYDGGTAGGNHNLTEQTSPVDGTAANDREITYGYDYRNRRITSQTSDGTTTFLSVSTLDNVGNTLTETGYHTSATNGNRISHIENGIDSRGRTFETSTFGVDPGSGNLTNALIAGTWFDPDDNPIQQTQGGNRSATKTEYDGLNQPVLMYSVVPGTIPGGAPANDVSDDLVVEQSEADYNEARIPVLFKTRQRLPDATGKGPLQDATGAEPQARVSWNASYQDGIGRNRFSANFGTYGGAELSRPETPPPASETVLVTETRYSPDGLPGQTVAADGEITVTKYDALKQPVGMTEALGSEAERTQRMRWHASGQMEYLILENPDTGEQVTTWKFGSTLATSDVARNDVIVGKVYPTGESSSTAVNRQGEEKSHVQPNGTTHDLIRNKAGQLLHDAVSSLGPDIDGAVRRISTEYNERGLRETITSWDNASAGAGTVVNQVGQKYDAFNQLITDQQEHDGAIDGATPEVNYGFTDGSNNTLRAISVTTPSGSRTDSAYGTANGIDDIFNRVASLKVNGETDNLSEYTYAGLSMVATVKYPAPDAELSFVKQAGATGTGDAGDSLTGYDRFGRIIDMPWRNASSADVLAQVQYGYDTASRRKWRQDLTPAANREHDRFYQYDELGQVESVDVGTLNQNRTAIGGVASESESWNYDETGNWQHYQKGEGGVSTIDETRTNNVSNQITTIDGSSSGIAHDLNGNTTLLATGEGLQGPPRKLIWDAWNRLVDVRNASDNSLVGKYAYDGLFRRTSRELNDGTVFHSFYNSAWRSVEERKNASTNPVEIFYWGARSRWDLVRRGRDSNGNGTLDETLFCLKDALDPIAVIDGSGAIQERYGYTAFGGTSILGADYSNRANSDFEWKFLFHGEFRDSESDYYNYGFRYYAPVGGRWTSRDPIAEIGGLNLYGFVGNDGVKNWDYLGLDPQSPPNLPDPFPSLPHQNPLPKNIPMLVYYECVVRAKIIIDPAGDLCGPCPEFSIGTAVGPLTKGGVINIGNIQAEAVKDAGKNVPDGCKLTLEKGSVNLNCSTKGILGKPGGSNMA